MSLVPDVLDNLVAMARGSDHPDLDGLQVYDGPEPGDPETVFLLVGATTEDLTSTTGRVPAGLVATTDSVDVPCSVRAWSGDLDLPTLRRTAYTVYEALRSEVEADRTLRGACSTAEIVGHTYLPALLPEQGYLVDVTFTVRATRF